MPALQESDSDVATLKRAVALAFAIVVVPPAVAYTSELLLHALPWVGPERGFASFARSVNSPGVGDASALLAGALVGLYLDDVASAAGASAAGTALGYVATVPAFVLTVGLTSSAAESSRTVTWLTSWQQLSVFAVSGFVVVATAVLAAVATATLFGPVRVERGRGDADGQDRTDAEESGSVAE